ncbi:rhodanese-like domain-containing protein [Salinimicrobium flavum]|uniref:Rhodanese-like domain-containing protein n=1 Tax=Salinimicrobium flavum TaxID=1737065 RepID=A0ABW5IZS1_9FLAO
MFESIKRLFGIGGPKADFPEMVNNGAIIIDVRTKSEFMGGHIKGSKNIPVNSLRSNLTKFRDKDKPIITCCASGMRSASAKNLLESHGYTSVYNAGSWRSLQNKLS